MRILLLSDINSPHTQKWAVGLADAGIQVGVFSFHKQTEEWNRHYNNIDVYNEKVVGEGTAQQGLLAKFSYLKSRGYLMRVIRNFKPDVVHAHYASSYGLLGALSGFRPYFISAWGSDLMRFPNGMLQRAMLKFNLGRATWLFATSRTLHDALLQLGFPSTIIPFGVDTDMFSPQRSIALYGADEIVIGTVKSLQPLYRIDWIVKAFAHIQKQRPALPLRLMIVGGGSLETELKQIARLLCKNNTYHFTGRVDSASIPAMHQQLDIFVHTSLRESFGVSTLEASACGKAVVACQSGGAEEVAVHFETALLFAEDDFDGLTTHLLKLVDDEALRKKLGEAGRQFVCENFDWNRSVQQMIAAYQTALNRK
ncbi:MAG: glycosyltransferase [Flavobacteriales bacterium]